MAEINSGVRIGAPIVPSATEDTYPTHDSQYGKGGHMEVADATARLAISTDRRTLGMLVTEQDTLDTYKLTTLPNTWTKLNLDVTSSYLYVAYASDDSGTDWNLTPSALLTYRAEINSETELTPVEADFSAATWVKYIGDDGADGADGADGTDADIDVVAGTDICVVESLVGTVKTFTVSYCPYVANSVTVSISGGQTFEVGTSNNLTITYAAADGSEANTSWEIVSPARLIEAWASNTSKVLTDNAVEYDAAGLIYTGRVSDGVNTQTASKTVSFYYPILWGVSATSAAPTYYDFKALGDYSLANPSTHTINWQAETNKYLWFLYPAVKNGGGVNADLSTIINQATNYDMLDAGLWVKQSNDDVTSTGLDSNWTVAYKIYRTNIAVSAKTFKFTI